MCSGKVAVVTGAAGAGMGRSIALTLAREGASVVVNYRSSAESAAAIVRHIEGQGGKAVAAQADVMEQAECEALASAATERFGGIDVVVIGPGAAWHPEPPDELDAASALADAQQELAPLYHLLPLVLPGMYERQWGRVIALALAPPFNSPAYAYNVGKAARTHAMLLARDQAWKHGVSLNVIGPGPVAGIETLEEAVAQCGHDAPWQNRTDVSPQDIAEGVAFLCSDAGRFISGAVLPYLYTGA